MVTSYSWQSELALRFAEAYMCPLHCFPINFGYFSGEEQVSRNCTPLSTRLPTGNEEEESPGHSAQVGTRTLSSFLCSRPAGVLISSK